MWRQMSKVNLKTGMGFRAVLKRFECEGVGEAYD